MAWTQRDEQIYAEIEAWQRQMLNVDSNDFIQLYTKWLENGLSRLDKMKRNKVSDLLENALFYLHAFLQNSEGQAATRKQIIEDARLFHENVETIEDLKKLKIDALRFLASRYIARERLYASGQGGLSGFGGVLLLGLDLPFLLTMNLRAIQTIALIYGNDVRLPRETAYSLQLFHAAVLPRRFQKQAWERLEEDVFRKDVNPFFYDEKAQDFASSGVEQMLKQIGKCAFISLLARKPVQGIPLLGIGFGAISNYRFTRGVTEFAHFFYQKRYLVEKR